MSDDEDSQKKSKPRRIPNSAKVKNKAPNKIQITAEQLIREAKERELEVATIAPYQKITNLAELKDFQLRKRKDYEDNIRKNRLNMHNWIKYANFEDKQNEIQRARSVYERALDVNHRCIPLWLKYSEMELKNGQVNHARNLLDRAVQLLPRVSQFWFRRVLLEERLGNPAACRQIFERWMRWQPEETAWNSYINFEFRHREMDRARRIYEIFVQVHPEAKNWIKYAKFLDRNGLISAARLVYERAVEFFDQENPQANLLLEFARFEERQKEHERSRVIYKFGIDNLPQAQREEIYKAYSRHEKRFGSSTDIEKVLLSKRRAHYEAEIETNSHNYDAWFDLIRLEKTEEDVDRIRNVFEKSIAQVPPVKEKRYWRRYIYLWIYYVLFEELTTKDMDRARNIYRLCLELIPHKLFTFSKIWILYANFEIRQNQLKVARKYLGMALGVCSRDKLFRYYIQLEIDLKAFDRVRKLYNKFLEFSPTDSKIWIKYAEFETDLDNIERARQILELAVSQDVMDMPESVWKTYIDFEISQMEWSKSRALYNRLLDRVQHVRVWISYAHFELHAAISQIDDADAEENESAENTIDHAISVAREVYKNADKSLRLCDVDQRACLRKSWLEFEEEFGNEESFNQVQKIQPQRVKRRKRADDAEGWEEYYDYIYPDDEDSSGLQGSLALLSAAKQWKKRQMEQISDEIN